MITAKVYDGGTAAVRVPNQAIGMDGLYWREVDYEEDVLVRLVTETNAAMRDTGQLDIAPWPYKVARHAPVDFSPRYEGLTLRLHHVDGYGAEHAELPLGEARLVTEPSPLTRPKQANVGRMLSPAELQQRVDDPCAFVRLPFRNETGGCQLREPLFIRWRGQRGARYALSLDDNDFFTPFDTRHTSRYTVLDDDFVPIDADRAAYFAQLAEGGEHALYLRPRRWRWTVKVLAHFMYYTGWGAAIPNDEWFVSTYFDRPPFYPYRQNILLSTQQAPIWHEYESAYLSWDQGIDYAWDHSWHAAKMRREILQQQYASICVVYVLMSVEPAVIHIWRAPVRCGEIVAGIGRVDQSTGREQRVWLYQRADVTAEYPQTYIGGFWGNFFIR